MAKFYTEQELKKLSPLQVNDIVDTLIWVSIRHDPARSIYPPHGHGWGEFIYAFNGVMEVKLNQMEYLTPPPYGIWLPPHVEHTGVNRTAVSHATIYVHESLCTDLPQAPGILLSSDIVSAILNYFRQSHISAQDPAHQRLLYVLLDQLKEAKLVSSYLPTTQHVKLREILNEIYENPADQSSLKTLAERKNMTERTLARLAQKELRMSLNEWRQRCKIMQSMTMLNSSKSVENIALDLGYANASAFINMFKKWMKTTPDQFRKVSSK